MKQKIIYLDDSELALEMVQHTLEQAGFEVYTASAWPEINPYLFRDKVRFLLCDINMPGLPGARLCETLKECLPDLTIIFFSSLPEEELETLSDECGADGWISKHSEKSEWISKIQEYLVRVQHP